MKHTQPLRTAALALCLLAARDAGAIPLLAGFGGPTGYGLPQNCLHPNDDGSYAGPPPTTGAPPVAVRITDAFPAGLFFFGSTHRAMFVNTNGNITFRGALAERTPVAFPVTTMERQPMIAPWWADVDTRGGGQPARNNICFHVDFNRVVVTWNDVGYFSSHDTLLNDFQLILTPVGGCAIQGDFDIEFRYNRCSWTTGDASGGSGGFGGTPAQMGFDAGNRRDHYVHPMSRTMGILDVCRTTNVPGGAPGLWRFQVRNSAPGCLGGTPCTVAGQSGSCAQGAVVCDPEGAPQCVATNAPRDERCNGYDDDCDGMIDDGDGLCADGYLCDRGTCAASCLGGRRCPAGLTCTGAVCLEDACARLACPVGQRCEAGACVGICDGVSCPAGQVCRIGRCADPCAGVTCGAMEVCDRNPGATAGRCVRACPCAGCPAGQQCQADGYCVPADCVDVRCPAGSYCRGGRCRDACEAAPDLRVCPRGEVCQGGACVVDRAAPGSDAGLVDADAPDATSAGDGPSDVDVAPALDVADAAAANDGPDLADRAARVDVGGSRDAGGSPAEPPSGGCQCRAAGPDGPRRAGLVSLVMAALLASTARRRRARLAPARALPRGARRRASRQPRRRGRGSTDRRRRGRARRRRARRGRASL